VNTIFIAPDGRLRAIWRFVFSVVFVIVAPMFLAQWVIGAPIQNDLARDIVVTCSTALFALLGSLFLLSMFDQVSGGPGSLLRELGFSGGARRAFVDSILGLAAGFIMITIAVLAIALFGRIRPARVPINLHTFLYGIIITFWLVVAAISEELQFRLYAFRELRESMGTVFAAVLLSVMFGAVHTNNPGFGKVALLNTALIGGLLAMAYIRTRTVWMIWAIHFGWNFALGVIYGLPVSGFSFAVAVRSTTVGSRWLTGNRYGIEASLNGAFVILIGYVLVWFFTAPRAREFAKLEAIRRREEKSPPAVPGWNSASGNFGQSR
jgi:membrane protease YdiL (CAAX protease family)